MEDLMQEDGNGFRYIGTSYKELTDHQSDTIKTVVAGRVGVTTGDFQSLEVGDDLISACYTVMERVGQVAQFRSEIYSDSPLYRNHRTIARWIIMWMSI